MYTEYEDAINEEELLYEQYERTSDIQLPPVMNILLFVTWIVISLIGLVVIFLARSPVVGTIIIAVPTFIGMVMKPTFGLCMMMLVLPTGAGIGIKQSFSLDRGVGIALAISFALNLLITRPRLRIGNKVLWVMALYTLWIFLASLAARYLGQELVRAFTQVQLLVLILIVYWILVTNGEKAFRWALRAYVIGTLGTIMMAFMTGAAMRTLEDSSQARYAATLGEAIDANMLAALTSMAFLAAIYLFARDRRIFWRVLYLVAIVFLPIILLRIGSRGAIVALAFTMLSPLLFIRQVSRRPVLVVFLLGIILLASISAGLVATRGGIESPVSQRLTDIGYAKESLRSRMQPIKLALKTTASRPTGTGYYSWFERTGTLIWPHNDFFLALGVYGIPGAVLFSLIIVMLMLTVKRIPLGVEKLYTRAILTFLIVMGLTIGQLFHKYFWVFLAFVMAGEWIVGLYAPTDDYEPTAEYADDSLTQYYGV